MIHVGAGILRQLALSGLALWLCLTLAAAQAPEVIVRFEALRRFEDVRPDRVAFRHLTIEEGLSQNAVYALLQDRQGFLWVGTKDGLNRYDGYAFTVFRHDPFDPATLSSSYVTALLEDKQGHLWVGTQDGGLNRLERATATAVRYTHGPGFRITALAEDARGDLWIGTAGGGAYRLARTDIGEPGAAFERFAHAAGDPRSLSDDRVTSVLADRRGGVWIGTEAGLNRLGAAGRGFVRYTSRPGDPGGLSDGFVTALAEARDGTIWVGSPLGLDRLVDARAGRFTSYPYPTQVQRRGYGWDAIRQIGEDPAGRLWLATADGLVRFDPATAAYTSFRHDPSDPHSISGNLLTALLWDRTGVLWVGANGYGINRYDAKTARFQTIRRPPDLTSRWDGFSIRALFEDAEGYVWMSAGVLYRYDPRTGTLVSFESTSDRPSDFGNTGVWSIVQDSRGALWFGSYEGLFRYDPVAGRTRQYAHNRARPGGLPEKMVYGVFEDRRGAIWAVTAHFISRLDDAATGRFTSYRHTPSAATDAGEALFPSLHEDARGHFWMATEAGLVRFDPRTGAVRRYRTDPADPNSLSHDQVRAICPDPRDPERILWLGTAGGGLNRFDIRTGTFTRLTERDGLPNNVVYAVLPDGHGRLWLSTNRGLARYDPQTGEIKAYDARDGLQSNEFNAGAYFRAPDGRLYFGGIHGVSSFDPAAFTDNPHVPSVVLTGFRRAGQPEVPGAPGGALARAMSATDTLRLSYRDNVFTFEFAALDFSAPEKNRYAFRMEGFNTDWISAGANRSATYTNLPPGRYTFRVRGTNSDGVWNEEGTSVAVFIAPPPWRTWWAYTGYVLLALGAVWTVTRYRRNRLLLKHRVEIDRLEAEKLRALERIEGENLRELDHARSRFFANVSHEFRTPLTLTLGPLDDLKAGLYGPLAAPMAAQVDLARRNARRVLDLIEQILDVARLEAGRMPLRARRLDLGTFVTGVAQGFGPLAERKGIALDVQVPDEGAGSEAAVWADPEHLQKVVSNLLSNALKFTPEGGAVRVTVAAEEGAVRLAIRDSGPGIPAADLPHVFERFYRVDESAARMQPGTGIGLALVKELVDLHGGTIEVESEAGFGSLFMVALRRGRDHLRPEDVVEDGEGQPLYGLPALAVAALAPDEVSGDGALDGGGEDSGDEEHSDDEDVTTVLVVDDSAEIRAYVRRHLGGSGKAGGYRVVEAADGAEGLAKARALLPDLVLSDVMMPGMDGFALCRALKADAETDFIPVVLLTARAEAEDRLAGLGEHADDYLTKPFDVRELRVRVDNLIASRRRLRERFASGAAWSGSDGGLHPAPVEVDSADAVFLERVRGAVEAHLGDEDFTVERLADAVGVSRGHLHRQLKALAGQAPSEAIRTMRLERAAQLLAARAGTVSEVAYAVGFKSVAHFSNSFEMDFDCRPSAYPAES